MNNEDQPIQSPPPMRTITVDQDPFQKSFQDSAIQYLPYRILLIIAALGLLQLGKTSLPQDSVECIQDQVNVALKPIADFFNNTKGFGLTLMTIMQLMCDIQLVGMVIYWIIWGKSFIYPLSVGILGISKVLINILFKTRIIPDDFHDRVFVSLLFGQNFQNTYFFSGITAFLTINLLQFWNYGYKRIFYIQIGVMIYVMFFLLAMRLNFFMDIITGLAFGYIVYTLLDTKRMHIDNFLLNPRQSIRKILDKDKDDQPSTHNNQNNQ